jgi:hypothetical protein
VWYPPFHFLVLSNSIKAREHTQQTKDTIPRTEYTMKYTYQQDNPTNSEVDGTGFHAFVNAADNALLEVVDAGALIGADGEDSKLLTGKFQVRKQ